MAPIGRHLCLNDANYEKSVAYGSQLLEDCANHFEASRQGKAKVNYKFLNSFAKRHGSEGLFLCSGIGNISRLLQIVREEFPFNSTSPQKKYQWRIVYEVYEPDGRCRITSLRLGMAFYAVAERRQLSAKEIEKQSLLPRKKVITFPGGPKASIAEPLDYESVNDKLFRQVMDAFERSRIGKKTDVDYGSVGYRETPHEFRNELPITLLKIVKEKLSYNPPYAFDVLPVKKQWSVIYKTQEGKEEECSFAYMYYPKNCYYAGRTPACEKDVIIFDQTV